MNGVHADVGPELKRLAQAILDGIDPTVRAAAAMVSGAGVGTGKCQQTWCPVCALAAVVTGEQHPLVTVIADHSVALLQVVRAIVDDIDRSAQPPPDGSPGGLPDDQAGDSATATGSAASSMKTPYQAIPITVEE